MLKGLRYVALHLHKQRLTNQTFIRRQLETAAHRPRSRSPIPRVDHSDVTLTHDLFLPFAREGRKGVRVLVKY
jgi:hypothetical protein